MSLLEYGQNGHYLEDIKRNIDRIVPFLGAGVSIPCGYPSWAELILKVLDSIRYPSDMTDSAYEKIKEYISEKRYMTATEEMSTCWPNLENFVCHEISTIIPQKDDKSCLEEYIHLFPSQLYLTTNYDDTIGRILRENRNNVHEIVATSPKQTTSRIGLREGRDPILWYLHGKYDNPDSIIFSNSDYNYFYGPDKTTDIKSIRRQLLARKLQEIYLRDSLLFIGYGMNMGEDRILKLLKRFNQMGLQPESFSYALLEFPGGSISEKEKELLTIKIHPIWYFAEDKNSHEQSKKELFEFILGDRHKAFETHREDQRREFEDLRKKEEETKREFENASKIVFKIPYCQKYYNTECDYEFALIKGVTRYYLSDQGRTFEMLDNVFELKEQDVQRNIFAIVKECEVNIIKGNLVIPLESLNGKPKEQQKELLEKAKCTLFTCVSFLDKMRIFYT